MNVAVVMPSLGDAPSFNARFASNNGAIAKELLSNAKAQISLLTGSSRDLDKVPLVRVGYSAGGPYARDATLSGAGNEQMNLSGGGLIILGGQYRPHEIARAAKAIPGGFFVSISTNEMGSRRVPSPQKSNADLAILHGQKLSKSLGAGAIKPGDRNFVASPETLHSNLPGDGRLALALKMSEVAPHQQTAGL
jgi:hypothetical protein